MRKLSTFLACLLPLVLSACTAPQLTSEPTANPQFDWFEYEGRDPGYERVTAGPGEYLNPILAGFYPDPSIVGVGEVVDTVWRHGAAAVLVGVDQRAEPAGGFEPGVQVEPQLGQRIGFRRKS